MKNEDLNAYLLNALPYIRHIAKAKARWGISYLDEDDLMQEGLLGLMQAFKRYGNRNIPFMAFALPRIKGNIIYALRKSMFAGRCNKIPSMIEISEYYHQAEIAGRDIDESMKHYDKSYATLDYIGKTMTLLPPLYQEIINDIYYKNIERACIAKQFNWPLGKLILMEQKALRALRDIIKEVECN